METELKLNASGEDLPPASLGYGLAVVTILGSLFATAGVIPVLLLLAKSIKDTQIPIEMLFLNYSLTIVLQLVKMVVFDVTTMASSDWLFGNAACAVTGFVSALLRYSTLSQLGMLLLDRYVCLNYLEIYQLIVTKSRMCIAIIMPWLLAAYASILHTTTPGGISFQHGAYRCDVAPDAGMTSLFIQVGTRIGYYAFIIGLIVIVCRTPVSSIKNVMQVAMSEPSLIRRHTGLNRRLHGQMIATRVVGLIILIHLPTNIVTLCISVSQFKHADSASNSAILCFETLSIFLAPIPFYIFGDKIKGSVLMWIRCKTAGVVPNSTFTYINHGRIVLREGHVTLAEDNNGCAKADDIEVGQGHERFWCESEMSVSPRMDIKGGKSPSMIDQEATRSVRSQCSEATTPQAINSAAEEFEISLCTAVEADDPSTTLSTGLFGTEVGASRRPSMPNWSKRRSRSGSFTNSRRSVSGLGPGSAQSLHHQGVGLRSNPSSNMRRIDNPSHRSLSAQSNKWTSLRQLVMNGGLNTSSKRASLGKHRGWTTPISLTASPVSVSPRENIGLTCPEQLDKKPPGRSPNGVIATDIITEGDWRKCVAESSCSDESWEEERQSPNEHEPSATSIPVFMSTGRPRSKLKSPRPRFRSPGVNMFRTANGRLHVPQMSQAKHRRRSPKPTRRRISKYRPRITSTNGKTSCDVSCDASIDEENRAIGEGSDNHTNNDFIDSRSSAPLNNPQSSVAEIPTTSAVSRDEVFGSPVRASPDMPIFDSYHKDTDWKYQGNIEYEDFPNVNTNRMSFTDDIPASVLAKSYPSSKLSPWYRPLEGDLQRRHSWYRPSDRMQGGTRTNKCHGNEARKQGWSSHEATRSNLKGYKSKSNSPSGGGRNRLNNFSRHHNEPGSCSSSNRHRTSRKRSKSNSKHTFQ